MNPFQQRKKKLMALSSFKKTKEAVIHGKLPASSLISCPECKETFSEQTIENALGVCPYCGHHHKWSAKKRIAHLIDESTFSVLDSALKGKNPLLFPGYSLKIKTLQKETGLSEGVICGYGKIQGYPVVIAVMDSAFFMGSMGSVVGEKITRAIEYATEQSLPLIICSASGGARMQEGIFSLMQMAKTAGALERHSSAGLFYLSILTNPTTGGVTASFASLGDVILAEPNALIGFAGSRVIEETIKKSLPSGFQRSEYLLEHGFIDGITDRRTMKDTIGKLLSFHERKEMR